MNQLQKVFNYQDAQVRTVVKDGEIWFVAKDVCEILEIQNTTQAIQKLDNDERSMFNIGRQGESNIVSEYGLYNLILTSRKSEAKQFKRWVTHEVLPEIRNTGQYNSVPKDYKEALLQLVASIEEKEKLEAQNKLMAPKADMLSLIHI